jgi:gamma-glutamyltranspeptidase/glutathione hydrolase
MEEWSGTMTSGSRLLRYTILFVLMSAPAFVVAQDFSIGEKGAAAIGTKVMIATAHPLATEAGAEMFRRGGNAVDAAVAAAFAIGVVEPDGSGIGGGGGILIHLKNGKSVYINCYGQTSSRIMEIGFVYGKDNRTAKAILIPGAVAGLTAALKQYGSLPLGVVLQPAIRYAEKGFRIDETLSKIILDNTDLLQRHPVTASVYLRDGFPRTEGDTIVQPDLARTLKAIAQNGPSAFYTGPIAKEIVDEVVRYGGMMTLEDLASLQPIVSEPVEGTYRGLRVISAPPPHSGVTVIEALQILDNTSVSNLGYYANSAESFHLLAETLRRAYADRIVSLADPRFERVPVKGLLSQAFAQSRFQDISMTAVTPPEYRQTTVGTPLKFEPNTQTPALKDSSEKREPEHGSSLDPAGGHTTQISVMDREGNSVSLTQTLGTFFGSGVTASGVLLNNGMSNFASTAKVNTVNPNKQPRSSISPTILLKGERTIMVVGSPGAARIPATVVTLIVNAVDYGLDAEKTNSAPRFLCQRSEPYISMESRFSNEAQEGMKKKGHQLRLYGDFDLFFGGAQIILVDSTGTMYGSADPRRGGTAMGY